MIKRDQLIECMSAMEEGMKRTATSRDIWQNQLIWWICKSLYLLLEREVKKPHADVAEEKHGNWVFLDNCANAGVYCSNCHKKVYKADYANQKLKSNFCPNCGAKMDKEEA